MLDLENLGIWVGLIGGFSGFAALAIQFRTVYIQSPRISCNASWAINPDSEVSYLNLSVINRGNQSIEVLNVGIQYENRKHSPFSVFDINQRSGYALPKVLMPHSQLSWNFDYQVALAGSKANGTKGFVKCYVNLGNGKTELSRRYWFEPDNKRKILSFLNPGS